MAVEVIRGQKNTPQARLPKTEEPSWIRKTLEQAATGLATAPSQFAQGIGRAFSDIAPSVRGGMPEITSELYSGPTVKEQIRSAREKSAGLPQESLTPKGTIQKTLDRIYSDVPIIAATTATGFPLLSALGLSASGNLGAQAAEDLNLGPIGEFLGYIGGAKLGSKGFGKIKNIYTGFKTGKEVKEVATGVRPHLEKVKKEAYKNSERLFQGVKVPSNKIEDALDIVHRAARKGLSSDAKTEVIARLDELGSKFHQNEVPIQDLIDAKVDVNKWAYSRDSEQAPYFKRVAKILNDAIQDEGKINKIALKSYNQAEELHQILNSGEEVKRLIAENFDIKKFSKSKILKSLFGIAGEGISLIPAGEATKFFVRRPEARNYYMNIMKSVVQENPAAAINSLKKLVSQVDKYEEKTSKNAPKIEVLRGSRI